MVHGQLEFQGYGYIGYGKWLFEQSRYYDTYSILKRAYNYMKANIHNAPEDVKEALLQSDIDWFEYHNVHGIGQSRQERIYRGVQYSTDVIERVALTIVCRDHFVEPTVKVILNVAHTGEVGDGRIFVSDMIDTWSIRTGENGDTVLRDKK